MNSTVKFTGSAAQLEFVLGKVMMLPYECLAIASPLSPEDVRRKLVTVTKQMRRFSLLSLSDKPYHGKVKRDEFKIARTIWYSNSGRPIIKGRIYSEEYGSSIYITMYPDIAILGLLIFLMGFIGYQFSSLLADNILSVLERGIVDQTPLSSLVIPCGILMFSYLPLMGAFKFESAKSKAFLRDLFEESGRLECEIRHYGMTVTQIILIIVLAVISIDVFLVVWRFLFPSIIQIFR
ncbi:MAG: hypothetical protein GY845_36860 [Planctomycetes bacterium]|nr:hypothetical protein [Planctomycetota bacterium]